MTYATAGQSGRWRTARQAQDYVRQHVLAVSTYLGHVGLTGTFAYLHTTPQLLADIADRCEEFAKGALS